MEKQTILIIAVIIGLILFGNQLGLFTVSSTSPMKISIENPSDPRMSNYIKPIPFSTKPFYIKFGVTGNSIITNPIIACNGKKITSFESITASSFSDGKYPKLINIKGYRYSFQYQGQLSKSNGVIVLHATVNFGSMISPGDYIICEILNSNGQKGLSEPNHLWFNGGF